MWFTLEIIRHEINSLKKTKGKISKVDFLPTKIIINCHNFSLFQKPLAIKFSSIFQFDEEYEEPTAHVLCYIINWLSVIMNPVIYVVTNGKYRVAVLLLYKRVRFFQNPQKYRRELELSNRKMSQVIRSSNRPMLTRQQSNQSSDITTWKEKRHLSNLNLYRFATAFPKCACKTRTSKSVNCQFFIH